MPMSMREKVSSIVNRPNYKGSKLNTLQIIRDRCPGNFGLPNPINCPGFGNCHNRIGCWKREYKWWMRFINPKHEVDICWNIK
jgi:hypothetical protein